ncbi:MAG: LCP family protein [Anaerolineales bacterium]|nr:LCP family protein [Anaerolineales bacterium]
MPTRPYHLCLYLFLLTCLSACSFGPAAPTAVQTPTPIITVTVPADATMTATPFLPGDPSAATTAPQPWGNYPPPQVTPVSTQIPPPVDLLPQPASQVTILLLGADFRPGRSGARTDVMILLTIRADGSVSLVSFPRDLYVYIPGWGMQRLNAAQPYGGFELTALTFEYNFGIRPQHYVETNLNGFMDIVDSLGGIEVQAARALSDQRDGYPEPFTVGPGRVFMDSATALWYVRSRGTTNDLDRLRRGQEVLVAIGRKLLTLDGLGRVPELYQTYQRTVETDLSLDALLLMLPLLQAADSENLNRYMIGADQTIPWTEPGSGAQYLLPDRAAIRALLAQALSAP